MRFLRVKQCTLAAAAALLSSLLLVGCAPQTQPAASDATEQPGTATVEPPSLHELVPAFADPQTSADRATAETIAGLGDADYAAADLRRMGRDEVAEYWIAEAEGDRACVLIYIPGEDGGTSSSCADRTRLYRYGTFVTVRLGDVMATGYLLPADIEASALGLPDGAVILASVEEGDGVNFVAGAFYTSGGEPITVRRSDGEDFTYVR